MNQPPISSPPGTSPLASRTPKPAPPIQSVRIALPSLAPTVTYVLIGFTVIVYLLQLAALLSVNLAIVNALPFPALDGGRVLFLIIEKIKGSPVSESVEKAIHTAGFVLLILLMIVITFKDIARLF